jgi:aldose 1-epimerase
MSTYTQLQPENFITEIGGKQTRLITLQNSRGMTVRFTTLGAKIQQIVVPDRDGKMDDVALGYENIAQVITGQASMGAFVGRYANRIAKGRFTLDGRQYSIEPNNSGQLLHGGKHGSRTRVFDVLQEDAASAHLALHYTPEIDGFPGKLMSRVIYTVTEDNELRIEYDAACDSPTVVNMTSHIYFNLAGERHINAETLLNHRLSLNAGAYTPVGPDQVPTGEIRSVAGTPLDFRQPHSVGERIAQATADFEPHTGYDHNWVLDKPPAQLGLAATLSDPFSGRVMEVHTTEPAIVFFSGNNLAGESPRDIGKGGIAYRTRSALCLEPGHFPDSPNHANFPSTVLRPGEWFSGQIAYRFLSGP